MDAPVSGADIFEQNISPEGIMIDCVCMRASFVLFGFSAQEPLLKKIVDPQTRGWNGFLVIH
jgi:hypothetical protein